MRISKNFLNDYIDIQEILFNEIAEKMIFLGNEYDEVTGLVKATNLVVGKIIDIKKHPESDKLSICQVDIGDEIKQIICGAPNVEVNQKVIVAKIGATLANGLVIKKATLAGYESNGMICSLAELGIENKYLSKEDIEGIHILEDDAKIGEDAIKHLGFNDEIIDFDLTANRGDLLSVLGMAYEIGAIYNLDIKMPSVNYNEIGEDINNNYQLKVETNNCPVYLAKLVQNVSIKESPKFIKNRLIASGIRPINNVVDISNYVMLETGQPLHFFDADKLGSQILVRMAGEGEEIITLDNNKRILSNKDIVITDGEKPVALAGVMGGLDTEVTMDTKNIIIESAIFNSANIRNTSKKTLRSESSNRFEKGICKERTYLAIKRASYLLNKYASGEVVKGMLAVDNLNQPDKKINITLKKINNILGMNLTKEDIMLVMEKLKFCCEYSDEQFKIVVPTRRLDINIEEDIIEEVGRIIGYDNVVGVLPITVIKKGSRSPKNELILKLRKYIQSFGLNEVITYSLISEVESYLFINNYRELVKLIDPISKDKSIMRGSLLPSLINVYNYNNSRNIKNINIFEIGSIYYKENNKYVETTRLSALLSGVYIENKWQNNSLKANFYVLKGIVENLLNYLGFANRYEINYDENLKDMHPGRSAKIIVDKLEIGFIGQIHPSILKNEVYGLEIDLDKVLNLKTKPIKYKEPSKYPTITKDLAFVVDVSISSQEIVTIIKKVGGRLLAEVDVFDVYVGEKLVEGKKSIAYSLLFKDENRTLNDEEVMIIFNKIINEVEDKLSAKLRNE